MARVTESEDPIDPTNDANDEDQSDDPEFAEGFGVFDPDDEQDLTDGGDTDTPEDDVLGDAEDEDLDLAAVLPLEDTQFDTDDAPEPTLDADGAADEEVEGVRGTEFVCRGCYLAKRLTQLADKKRSLCIDCV